MVIEGHVMIAHVLRATPSGCTSRFNPCMWRLQLQVMSRLQLVKQPACVRDAGAMPVIARPFAKQELRLALMPDGTVCCERAMVRAVASIYQARRKMAHILRAPR